MKYIEPKNSTDPREGRWTDGEHQMFLEGLELYGKNWQLVANHVQTRNAIQVKSHSQKYFLKAHSTQNEHYWNRQCQSGPLKDKATQYGEGVSFSEVPDIFREFGIFQQDPIF